MNDTAPAVPSSSRKAQAPEYYLTITEVATVLGIHRATVLREIERGRLTCSHELRITPRYTRRKLLAEDLLAYVATHGTDVMRLHVERRIAETLAA